MTLRRGVPESAETAASRACPGVGRGSEDLSSNGFSAVVDIVMKGSFNATLAAGALAVAHEVTRQCYLVRMSPPKEIAPGLFHWTATHPEIRIRVSSYYLAKERVLLDPLLPSPGGLRWLEDRGPPEHIFLTCRLHSRHSAKLVAAFGCQVWCHRRGLYHLAPELSAKGFVPGDELPGGARVIKVGVLCPDESAILLRRVRAAAVADGVVRDGNGPLSFVPDSMLVDDPSDLLSVKRGLKAAFRRVAGEEFEPMARRAAGRSEVEP